VASIVTVKGVEDLDGALFMTNLPRILITVYTWAASNTVLTKSPNKFSAPRKVSPISTTPRGPRTSTNILGAIDPFNVFPPGSIKAALAALLSDRRVHTIAEMEALCIAHNIDPKWNVPDTFYFLRKKGGLTITRTGGNVQIN
jgi:hypothetical protein